MKVDVLASQLHYEDHLAAIWMALPAEVRGGWYAQGPCANAGNRQGVPGWKPGSPPLSRDLLLVAGYVDERNGGPRPTVYVEHGGGQTYQGLVDPSYSGSGGHEQVVLFLSPSETVAARWRARYPTVPAVAIGCPRLDYWHTAGRNAPTRTIAISFHHRNRLLPETDSAFDDYETALGPAVQELQRRGWEVLGHSHPRRWLRMRTFWGLLDVEAVQDFSEILGRADVYAIDNSSTGPEFASCGRPVIWMNCPRYRRDVHHGGRFWCWTEGAITVDRAEELPAAADLALQRQPGHEAARQRMVRSVYCATDGRATNRAVAAILGLDGTIGT